MKLLILTAFTLSLVVCVRGQNLAQATVKVDTSKQKDPEPASVQAVKKDTASKQNKKEIAVQTDSDEIPIPKDALKPRTIEDDSMRTMAISNRTDAKNGFKSGKREGAWFEYMDSACKKTNDTNAPYYALLNFKGGLPEGVATIYYRTGQIYSLQPFKNGKQEGITKWYYKDGNLYIETPYKKDHKNGVEKWYYEDGSTMAETPCFDDLVNGVKKGYFENGQLKYEYHVNSGFSEGVQKDFYDNGVLKEVTVWKDHKKVSSTTYDANGTLVRKVKINK